MFCSMREGRMSRGGILDAFDYVHWPERYIMLAHRLSVELLLTIYACTLFVPIGNLIKNQLTNGSPQ
jgi:hypothetical protein